MTAFENGKQVESTYTDFSRAYGKVNYNLFISKLKGYGFGVNVVNWLECFLTGRVQCVKLNNHASTACDVPSGVPQDSNGGLILFNLIISLATHSNPLFLLSLIITLTQFNYLTC